MRIWPRRSKGSIWAVGKYTPRMSAGPLGDLLGLRHQADYRRERVSQGDAQQAVRRVHTFVQAVTARVAGQGGGA
jgi:hypothetical protein